MLVKKMTEKMTNLLNTYGHKTSVDGIQEILDVYQTNKSWLINRFSKHPNWDAKNLAIIFSSDYEREIDYDQIRGFSIWFINQYEEKFIPVYAAKYMEWDLLQWKQTSRFNSERIEAIASLMIFPTYKYWAFSPENYKKFIGPINVINELIKGKWEYDENDEEVYRYSFLANLRENKGKLTQEQADKLNSFVPELKAVEGQKLSRVIRKLGNITGLEKIKEIGYNGRDYGWNRQFAMFADSVNPMKVKRHTVISVNPLDYLTSSFGHNWASCHTIDYKNYRDMDEDHNYHGMYMSGTLSYMLDESSFVFYTVDSSYNGNEFWTQDKMQRCIFNYQYNKLVQGRVYPDGRDGGDSSYAGQFRAIVQEVLATILDVPNLWVISHKIRENTVSEGTHYKDYLNYNDPCISILKGNENLKKIHIGHTPICPCCGQPHHNEDSLVCDNCKPHYCHYCHNEINSETGVCVDEDNNVWYCDEDCAERDGYVVTVDEGWQRQYECRREAYTGEWYYYWEERLNVYAQDGTWYLNEENAISAGYIKVGGVWYPSGYFTECPHCGALINRNGTEWNPEMECCSDCAIRIRIGRRA